jgi:hypothetical protein
MSRKWKGDPGDHKVISDLSGFEHLRSECRKTWDGLIVHHTDYDPKHPQLIIKPKRERVGVKDARPDQASPALADPSYNPAGGV